MTSSSKVEHSRKRCQIELDMSGHGFIVGAKPGDVLEVRILSITPAGYYANVIPSQERDFYQESSRNLSQK